MKKRKEKIKDILKKTGLILTLLLTAILSILSLLIVSILYLISRNINFIIAVSTIAVAIIIVSKYI
jgi:cobalamin biosynthesis protein CobD/CbiB